MEEQLSESSLKERLVSFRSKYCFLYKSFKYAKAFSNNFWCNENNNAQKIDGKRENKELKEECISAKM